MNRDAVKPKPRKLLLRVLAVVLAVLLLFTGVLYNASTVLLSADAQDKNASVLAARELLESDEYASLGMLGRMSAYMQYYLSVADSYEEYEQGAAIAISRGNYDDALACTDQSIACYEGETEELADLFLRKGYLYTLLEQYENAEDWLSRGIELHETPEAYLTRAQVRLNLGDTEGALEDVTIYIDTAEDALSFLPNLINVYEAVGDYQTATDCYTRLLASEEYQKTEYYLDRASCYVLLGDMEKALADCEAYLASGGEEKAEMGVMLGIGYLQSAEYQKASEAFLKAIDDGFAHPEALDYYLMLCAYVDEDYQSAAEYGAHAVSEMLAGMGGKTVALEMNGTAERLTVSLTDFDVSTLCLLTGAAYMQTGDYETAADVLTDCLKLEGSTAYVNYLRGNCLLSLGKYEEALADFNTAIAAEQETERSIYGRGICYLQLGNIDAATEDFRYVLSHSEDEELLSSTRAMMAELGIEE